MKRSACHNCNTLSKTIKRKSNYSSYNCSNSDTSSSYSCVSSKSSSSMSKYKSFSLSSLQNCSCLKCKSKCKSDYKPITILSSITKCTSDSSSSSSSSSKSKSTCGCATTNPPTTCQTTCPPTSCPPTSCPPTSCPPTTCAPLLPCPCQAIPHPHIPNNHTVILPYPNCIECNHDCDSDFNNDCGCDSGCDSGCNSGNCNSCANNTPVIPDRCKSTLKKCRKGCPEQVVRCSYTQPLMKDDPCAINAYDRGVIVKIDDCTFGIETASGSKLLPTNFSDMCFYNAVRDGDVVGFQYEVIRCSGFTCECPRAIDCCTYKKFCNPNKTYWGTPIRILQIGKVWKRLIYTTTGVVGLVTGTNPYFIITSTINGVDVIYIPDHITGVDDTNAYLGNLLGQTVDFTYLDILTNDTTYNNCGIHIGILDISVVVLASS